MDNPTAANPKITTCAPVEGYAPRVGRYVAQMNRGSGGLKGEIKSLT